MHSDTFHSDTPSDAPSDPEAGTAAIHPVTPEMMDEAAHRAAQLADDVAHHVVPAPGQAEDAHEAPAAAMAEAGEAPEVAADMRETAGSATAGSALVAAADRVDTAMAPTTTAAESPATGGTDALGRYQTALLGMVQTNLTATGELFAALVKAKSLPEVVAINTDHIRRQFDTMTAQGRELANLTQTLSFAAFKPLVGPSRDDA